MNNLPKYRSIDSEWSITYADFYWYFHPSTGDKFNAYLRVLSSDSSPLDINDDDWEIWAGNWMMLSSEIHVKADNGCTQQDIDSTSTIISEDTTVGTTTVTSIIPTTIPANNLPACIMLKSTESQNLDFLPNYMDFPFKVTQCF